MGSLLSPMLGPISGILRILSSLSIFLLYCFYIKIYGEILYIFIYVFFCATYGIILNLYTGYGLIQYVYNFPTYFAFMFLIPMFRTLTENQIIKISNVFLFSIGIILIGVILDHYFHIGEKLGLAVIQDADSTRRSAFLLGSPTAIFIVAISAILVADKSYSKAVVIMFFCITLVSTFFTFSRLPLILLFFSIILYLLLRAGLKVKFFSIFVFFIVLQYYVPFILDDYSSYIDKISIAFDLNDQGNSGRIYHWYKALSNFTSSEFVFGSGLGSSNLNLSRIFGTEFRGNFESSFLYMVSEMGYLGIGVFIFLVYYFYKSCTNLFEYCATSLILLNLLLVPLYAGFQIPFTLALTFSILNRSNNDDFNNHCSAK